MALRPRAAPIDVPSLESEQQQGPTCAQKYLHHQFVPCLAGGGATTHGTPIGGPPYRRSYQNKGLDFQVGPDLIHFAERGCPYFELSTYIDRPINAEGMHDVIVTVNRSQEHRAQHCATPWPSSNRLWPHLVLQAPYGLLHSITTKLKSFKTFRYAKGSTPVPLLQPPTEPEPNFTQNHRLRYYKCCKCQRA